MWTIGEKYARDIKRLIRGEKYSRRRGFRENSSHANKSCVQYSVNDPTLTKNVVSFIHSLCGLSAPMLLLTPLSVVNYMTIMVTLLHNLAEVSHLCVCVFFVCFGFSFRLVAMKAAAKV